MLPFHANCLPPLKSMRLFVFQLNKWNSEQAKVLDLQYGNGWIGSNKRERQQIVLDPENVWGNSINQLWGVHVMENAPEAEKEFIYFLSLTTGRKIGTNIEIQHIVLCQMFCKFHDYILLARVCLALVDEVGNSSIKQVQQNRQWTYKFLWKCASNLTG